MSRLQPAVYSIVVWAVSALGLLSGEAKADEADIAGKYQCKGVAAGGKAYEAAVEIAKQGAAYTIVWKFSDGTIFEGVALREANVLAVGFTGSYKGVVLYKIEPGPKLVGRWTVPQSNGVVYTETLER
jgi:hypothetical protein